MRVTAAELASADTVCLLPLSSEAPLDEARAKQIEALVLAAFRKRGFEAVDGAITQAAFERTARQQGGLYDVYDGQPAAGAASRASAVRRELGSELGCRSFVRPRIVLVTAVWNGGSANWDGATADVGGGVGARGAIGALSLHLRLTDADDRELYFGAGGIRLTSQFRDVYPSGVFEAVPRALLLADDAYIERATDLALAGLPSRSAAAGAP